MTSKGYSTPYAATFQVFRIAKYWRVYNFFTDTTIPDNTILCTVDNMDIPAKDYGWKNLSIYPMDVYNTTNCYISINSDNANVIYHNDGNKGFWGDFRGLWYTVNL